MATPPTNRRDPDAASANKQTNEGTARDHYFKTLYSRPPDFKELAKLDPDFAAVVQGRELDFNDPASVMQLTKTLLKLDFGLKIELPDDRLCPPVANRHNYILWLKDLLDSTSYMQPGRSIVGLDIGTGASCVYPLLGCTERLWTFIATDIDDKNVEWARRNVELNNLGHRIRVVHCSPDDLLVALEDVGARTIDFTMTNPPFYSSEAEMVSSAAKKSRPPFTACSGSKVEMVTAGGEVGFASRILDESLTLRDRVQWYTVMFGFLSSVAQLVEKLQAQEVDNYAVGELLQGSKTRRWTVAWSFQPLRPTQSVARGISTALPKHLLPPITEVDVVKINLPARVGRFADELSNAVGSLELISWDWNRERLDGTGRVADKVWARAWRRRRKQEMANALPGPSASEPGEPTCVFGFKVLVRVGRDGVSVCCRWLEGHDATAFESFQGFLKAAAKAAESEAKSNV